MSHAEASASPFARGTLARQLVVRVVAVVAVIAVLVTLVTLAGVRQVLVHQVDTQLRAVAARQQRPAPPVGGAGRDFGNPIGTLHVHRQGSTVQATIIVEGARQAPSVTVVQQALAVPADGRPHSLHLDGLGNYRAIATSSGGVTDVSAISLANVDEMLQRTGAVAACVALAALLLAVVASREVVRRSLRPLQRLATTANSVAELDLSHGEVELAVRAEQPATPSEVGRVAVALNQMLNHVEQALVARQASEQKVRQFVADASHELRNPLASIRGYAELANRHGEGVPPATAAAMQRIELESARMSRLVEDMLLLARLDDDPRLEPVPLDLVAVVLDAVSDARAAGPDHQWRLDLPEAPVVALADPHRIMQVVVNLLSNARKHTPPGTVVTTRVAAPGDRAIIEVIDDGPGIPEAVREQVFERFARADVARAHSSEPSTGLGLAIVQAVVAAHGGTVTVASEPGRTTFRVDLPLAADPPQ